MREIKFRAWCKGSKTMAYNIEGLLEDYITGAYPLMQYTGLKDKNGKGKEIYEKDIIRRIDKKTGAKFGPFLVEWEEIVDGEYGDIIGYGWSFTNKEEYDLEILGNLYQNPELMEQK